MEVQPLSKSSGSQWTSSHHTVTVKVNKVLTWSVTGQIPSLCLPHTHSLVITCKCRLVSWTTGSYFMELGQSQMTENNNMETHATRVWELRTGQFLSVPLTPKPAGTFTVYLVKLFYFLQCRQRERFDFCMCLSKRMMLSVCQQIEDV